MLTNDRWQCWVGGGKGNITDGNAQFGACVGELGCEATKWSLRTEKINEA